MKKQWIALVIIFTIMFAAFMPAQSQKVDSVSFASGDSLSTAVNTKGYQITAIRIPDALDGTSITFQDSPDGITYNNLIKTDGTEVKITIPLSSAIPNRKIVTLPVDVLGFSSFVKLRTGTYASETNQSEDVTVYVELTKMVGE